MEENAESRRQNDEVKAAKQEAQDGRAVLGFAWGVVPGYSAAR